MSPVPPDVPAGAALPRGSTRAGVTGSTIVTRITPVRGWTSLRLGELWEYRELLYFFTWRDLKVRYKQTVLGVLWAILQPLLLMLVFTLFFGRLARMPSDGVPYPLFAYCGLVLWTFLATGVTQASNSLVQNASLVTKVYFPRMMVPLGAVLAGLVDTVVSLVALLVLMGWYGVRPTPRLAWVPLLVLLALITAAGVGLWLSALNVQFRDVRYAVPFAVQLWFFLTPVVYPASLLPERWRVLYALNPMTSVVEGMRWALAGAPGPEGTMVVVSAAVAGALLIGGALHFRRLERTFADTV
jgi:homopolymeric O-antigen transport system permease protein